MSSFREKVIPRKWAAAVLLAALMIGVFAMYGASGIREDLELRRESSVREAVEAAAFECYAVEGVYPENLRYLEEHYGLMLDHDRYIVSYDCFASNEPPEVIILQR